ncbi:MAG: ExbD/TolR family protein [Opitutaceae bacterium]
MARKFHRKNRLSALTEINVTPLIDLAFALLIIFMITASVPEQTIEVSLPVESPKAQPEVPEAFQKITVDKAGDYYWDDNKVTIVELGDLLDTVAMNANPPVLRIRGDGAVPYQKVMTVMDMIKQRKLSKISLDTEAK